MTRDEDLYRDEEEIENEKKTRGSPVCEKGSKGNTQYNPLTIDSIFLFKLFFGHLFFHMGHVKTLVVI